MYPDKISTDDLVQALMVETLFHHQRQFLASSCSDRSASGGSGLMQAEEIKRIQNTATANVRKDYFTLYWSQRPI